MSLKHICPFRESIGLPCKPSAILSEGRVVPLHKAYIDFVTNRRSRIKPFEFKIKELEEGKEEGKIEKLILALKELAKTDMELAAILKKYRIL